MSARRCRQSAARGSSASWARRVMSRYCAVEAFKIGYFCEERTGFHLHDDLCHVRIVRADGTARRAGEPGEIVISNLVNHADGAAQLSDGRRRGPPRRAVSLRPYPPADVRGGGARGGHAAPGQRRAAPSARGMGGVQGRSTHPAVPADPARVAALRAEAGDRPRPTRLPRRARGLARPFATLWATTPRRGSCHAA